MSKPHENATGGEPHHILSLSGGKDSTALALYRRARVPNMEYVFEGVGGGARWIATCRPDVRQQR